MMPVELAAQLYFSKRLILRLPNGLAATAIFIGAAARVLAIRNSEGASTVDLWKAVQWIFEQ